MTIRGIALENNQPVINGVVTWTRNQDDSSTVQAPTDGYGNFTFSTTEAGTWTPDKVVGSMEVELD